MATINFAVGLDPAALSEHSRDVVEHILDTSGNPSCTVTCLGRSPHEQAVVMRLNCIRNGVDEQMRTYLPPGQAVIQVFVASKALNEADTIAAMEAEILRQGPSKVSRHCGDQSVLQVLDIAQSSLRDVAAFEAVANGHADLVSKCLDENRAVHIECPQPSVVT